MKYCRETTLEHHIAVTYPDCVEDLNRIVEREDKNSTVVMPLFKNEEVGINVDLAEEKDCLACKRVQDNSMDLSFGITNDLLGQRAVLVELRLNVKNPGNISTTELAEKVRGSSLLLTGVIPLHPDYFFVYPVGKTEEAKNRLNQPYSKANKNYRVVDIHELKATFF